jgi:hypothetical protein
LFSRSPSDCVRLVIVSRCRTLSSIWFRAARSRSSRWLWCVRCSSRAAPQFSSAERSSHGTRANCTTCRSSFSLSGVSGARSRRRPKLTCRSEVYSCAFMSTCVMPPISSCSAGAHLTAQAELAPIRPLTAERCEHRVGRHDAGPRPELEGPFPRGAQSTRPGCSLGLPRSH